MASGWYRTPSCHRQIVLGSLDRRFLGGCITELESVLTPVAARTCANKRDAEALQAGIRRPKATASSIRVRYDTDLQQPIVEAALPCRIQPDVAHYLVPASGNGHYRIAIAVRVLHST